VALFRVCLDQHAVIGLLPSQPQLYMFIILIRAGQLSYVSLRL
jgi:hypothetical protein